MATIRKKIAVVGGSIAGLSFAASMRAHAEKFDVQLYERASGRLVDKGAGLGCDPRLVNSFGGQPGGESVEFATIQQQRRLIHDGDRVFQESFGNHATSYASLLSFLRANVLDSQYNAEKTFVDATVLDTGAIRVTFADGAHTDVDLLVFADGFRSLGRSYVNGLDENSRSEYCGYALLRGCLDIDDDLDGQLELLPLADGNLHLIPTATVHGVSYAIPGANNSKQHLNWGVYVKLNWDELNLAPNEFTVSAQVLFEQKLDLVERFSAMSNASFPPLLKQLFDTTVKAKKLFLQPIYAYRPTKMFRDRFALIGDAAHVASPITGSGARFALFDSRALSNALASSQSIEQALNAYERERLSANQQLVDSGVAWGRSFVREN